MNQTNDNGNLETERQRERSKLLKRIVQQEVLRLERNGEEVDPALVRWAEANVKTKRRPR